MQESIQFYSARSHSSFYKTAKTIVESEALPSTGRRFSSESYAGLSSQEKWQRIQMVKFDAKDALQIHSAAVNDATKNLQAAKIDLQKANTAEMLFFMSHQQTEETSRKPRHCAYICPLMCALGFMSLLALVAYVISPR